MRLLTSLEEEQHKLEQLERFCSSLESTLGDDISRLTKIEIFVFSRKSHVLLSCYYQDSYSNTLKATIRLQNRSSFTKSSQFTSRVQEGITLLESKYSIQITTNTKFRK